MSAQTYERAPVSDCSHEEICQGSSSLSRGLHSQVGRNLKTLFLSTGARSQQVPSPRYRVYGYAFFPKNATSSCQPKEENLVSTTRELGRSSSGSLYQEWAVDGKGLMGGALKERQVSVSNRDLQNLGFLLELHKEKWNLVLFSADTHASKIAKLLNRPFKRRYGLNETRNS